MHFYLYVFIFFFFCSAAPPAVQELSTSRNTQGTGSATGASCSTKEQFFINEGITGCWCKNLSYDTDKLEECATRQRCIAKCKEHIGSDLSACGLGERDCAGCSGSSPVFQLSSIKRTCRQNNQATIQQNLKAECQKQLDELAQGRRLICPKGTAHNPNCETFCEDSAQKVTRNSCANNDGITSKRGFEQCQNRLMEGLTQRDLPRNLQDLAQKGFSFQNCALDMPSCEQPLAHVFQTNLNQCQQLKQKASLCCSDPLKCQSDQSSALFAGHHVTATGSISGSCLKLEQKLSQAGAVGQKMADQCAKSASHCQSQCAQAIKTGIQSQFYEVCAFDLNDPTEYSPATHTCDKLMIQKYTRQYQEKLFPLITQCAGEGKKAQNLSQMAEGLLKSALSAQACHQQASAGLSRNSATTDHQSDFSAKSDHNTKLPTASSAKFSPTQQENDAVRGGGGWRCHRITHQVFPAKEPDWRRVLAQLQLFLQKKGFLP